MKSYLFLYQKKAQTAVEYMILLAVVVAIILVAFKSSLPRVESASGFFFNRAARGIMGEPPANTVWFQTNF